MRTIEELEKNNRIVDDNFKKIVHDMIEKKKKKKSLGNAGEQPKRGGKKGGSV